MVHLEKLKNKIDSETATFKFWDIPKIPKRKNNKDPYFGANPEFYDALHESEDEEPVP
jgi:hypothetical protein